MTQPSVNITIPEVRSHAAAVDETARMLDEGLAGAQHVRASDDAYGQLIGPMFTGLLNPMQDLAIDQIRHAVTATQRLADLLRSVAETYQLNDDDAARRLGGHS